MRRFFSSATYISIPWVLCFIWGFTSIAAQNGWYPQQTSQNGINCGVCPQGTVRQVLFSNGNGNQLCGQCSPSTQSCPQGTVQVGNQCQQCPCPGTNQRSFGTSCRVDPRDNQVTCDCPPEYTGRNCGECAPGAVRSSQYPSNCIFLNSTNSQQFSCPAGNLCQPPQIQQIVTAPPIQQYQQQRQLPQIQCPISPGYNYTNPAPVYPGYPGNPAPVTQPCPQIQCPVVQPQPQPQPPSPWIPQPATPAPCPLLPQPGPGPILCPTAPTAPAPTPVVCPINNGCPIVNPTNPNPYPNPNPNPNPYPNPNPQCPVCPTNPGGGCPINPTNPTAPCPIGPTLPAQPCPPCPVQPPTACPQCPIQPPTVCPACPQPPQVVCPTPNPTQPCPIQNCPSPCPTLPTIPACPTVNCPSPCPTLPTIPACPQCPTPSCPSCPTIPACPQCPQLCPPCPQIPPCNPCPNPCPPCNQQPCRDCPSPCAPCQQNSCPDCKLTCNCANVTLPGIIRQLEPCICDVRGTVAQYGSECFCKDNVQGYKCDSCKPGYFALSGDSNEGCLECWGSGVSKYCSSAIYYRTYLRTSRDADCSIELTDERNTVVYNRDSSSKYSWDGNEARFNLPVSTRLFWSIPSCLKGNRLTSYGGLLRFERMFTGNGANLGADNDIMIVGGSGITLYWSSFATQNSGDWKQVQVRLDETENWVVLKGGLSRPATRFDILEVLADVQLVLIRATFTTSTSSTSIRNVALATVSKSATSEGLVFVIEQARCPVGYQGLSCESCSSGFYRDTTDMTASVFGACKLCPCGHNAEGCHISYGELKCVCKPGYTGDKCQSREVITVTLDPFWIREVEGAEVDYVCTFTTNSKRTLKMRLRPENAVGSSNADTEETLRITRTFKLTKAMGRIVCEIVDSSNVVWSIVYGATVLENVQVVALVPPRSVSIVVNTQFICVNETERVKMLADVNQYGSRSITPEWRKEGKPGVLRTGKVYEIPSARLDDQGTYIVSGSDGDVTSAEKIVLVVRPMDGYQRDDPMLLEGNNETIVLPPTKTQKEFVPKEKKTDNKQKSPSSYLNSMQADQPVEGYPTVVVDPEEVRVSPGQSVTLRCNASGEEPLKFYWKSGSVEYMPAHVRVSRGALIFKSVKKEDAGMYYCVAWNNLGQISARSNIIVEDPANTATPSPVAVEANKTIPSVPLSLSISQKQGDSRPGGNVYLKCDSSDPSAKPKWTRKSGNLPTSSQILEDGTLVLYRVSADDAGTYICSAVSSSGQSAQVEAVFGLSPLVPHVIPSLTLTPKSPLKVRSGDKVRVECLAFGYPTPNVKWSRTVEGSEKILVTSETNTTVYEILHATKSDEGKYTCFSSNEAGSKSESWSLSVDDAIICKSSEFRCKSGDQCVFKEDRCDGERDCNDGSDEHHCRKRSRRSSPL